MAASLDILRKVEAEIIALGPPFQVKIELAGAGNDFSWIGVTDPVHGKLISAALMIENDHLADGTKRPSALVIDPDVNDYSLSIRILRVPLSERGIKPSDLKKVTKFFGDAIRGALLGKLEKFTGLQAELEGEA